MESQTKHIDIASSISGEELKILQEYFANTEEVNEETFIELFQSLGGRFAEIDKTDYLKFFHKVDANANGLLDLDELLTFLLVGAEGQRRMNDISNDTSNVKWFRGNNSIPNVHKGKIQRIVADTANDRYYTASKDGSIKVWNSLNLQYERTLHQSSHSLTDMCFIPKDNILATCDLSRKIYFYDLTSRRLDRVFQGNLSSFHPLASKSKSGPSTFGSRLSSSTKSPLRYLHHSPMTRKTSSEYTLEKEEGSTKGLSTNTRRESNLTTEKRERHSDADRSPSKNVGVYPTVTLGKLGKRGNVPLSIAMYHQNNMQDLMILGCENGKIKIYDVTDKILDSYSLQPLFSGSVTPSSISSMAVGYDLSALIVAGYNPDIEVFSLEKLGSISTLRGHKKPIHKVDFSNSLNLIVSCGREKNVMIWNPLIKKPLEVLKGHKSTVIDVQFNSKDMELITLGDDKILKVWDIRMYRCTQSFQNIGGANSIVTAAAFNSKQEVVVCGGFEYGKGELVAVPLQRSHLSFKAIYNGPSHPIVAVLLKKSFGEVIVIDEFNVTIWNYLEGSLIYKFNVPQGIASCSFDPNQRRIIISYHTKGIGIYNYINGACLKKLNCEEEIYSCLYVDTTSFEDESDDDHSIWGLGDHALVVWGDSEDDEKDEPTSSIQLFSSALCGAIYETTCLLGFEDGSLRLYDAHSGTVKLSKRPQFSTRTIFSPISWSERDSEKRKNSKYTVDTKQHNHVEMILTPPSKFPLAIICFGNGIVEFRNCLHLECLLQFRGNPNNEAICTMAVDTECNLLILGDSDGFVAILDISSIRVSPPSSIKDTFHITASERDIKLVNRFRIFKDVVTSLTYDEERRMILAGSANCFAGMWTLEGKNVCYFGQTQKYNVDNRLTYGLGRSDKPIRNQWIERNDVEQEKQRRPDRSDRLGKARQADSELSREGAPELETVILRQKQQQQQHQDWKLDLEDIEDEISRKVKEKYRILCMNQEDIQQSHMQHRETGAINQVDETFLPKMEFRTKQDIASLSQEFESMFQ